MKDIDEICELIYRYEFNLCPDCGSKLSKTGGTIIDSMTGKPHTLTALEGYMFCEGNCSDYPFEIPEIYLEYLETTLVYRKWKAECSYNTNGGKIT